jgi:hypothetical protein
MLRRDSVDEAELIEILRESSPDQSPLLSNFEALAKNPNWVPGWTLEPDTVRRDLAHPQRVWEPRNVLTTVRFLCADERPFACRLRGA